MLVRCLTRQNKQKLARSGLNVVPIQPGDNVASASYYEKPPFSVEELSKAHALMSACDEDTCAHSWRIAHLARETACYMRLSETEIWMAFLSALLHDIGKAGIPWGLLNKQGPLNGKEWEMIRQHPGIGAQMLEEAGGIFAELAPLVLAHHER
jgi:HD-GYP domain-containing protein (c-di-GMP phosphodiesterase class II)